MKRWNKQKCLSCGHIWEYDGYEFCPECVPGNNVKKIYKRIPVSEMKQYEKMLSIINEVNSIFVAYLNANRFVKLIEYDRFYKFFIENIEKKSEIQINFMKDMNKYFQNNKCISMNIPDMVFYYFRNNYYFGLASEDEILENEDILLSAKDICNNSIYLQTPYMDNKYFDFINKELKKSNEKEDSEEFPIYYFLIIAASVLFTILIFCCNMSK